MSRSAFSLIESIVVVIVLFVLAGVGVVSWRTMVENSHIQAAEHTLRFFLAGVDSADMSGSDADNGYFTLEDAVVAAEDIDASADVAWDVTDAGPSTRYGELSVTVGAAGQTVGAAVWSGAQVCVLGTISSSRHVTVWAAKDVAMTQCSGVTATASIP